MFSSIILQRASAAIVAVVWAVSALIPGSAGGLTVQEGDAISIVVKADDEGRALKTVVRELERRFGWMVTYEDPAYLFAPEIKDVRHIRRVAIDRPLLVPRGGPFTFSYTLRSSDSTGSPQEALLGALLDQYHQTGYAGRFRLVRTGLVYHVVPAMTRDETGVLRPYGSILDRKISLPDREVSGLEMLESIEAALKESGEPRLQMGTQAINAFGRVRVRSAAHDESARSVLVRMLASFNPRLRFSWRLLCGPQKGSGTCFLNLHHVPPVPS
jgi:hypothetical protein